MKLDIDQYLHGNLWVLFGGLAATWLLTMVGKPYLYVFEAIVLMPIGVAPLCLCNFSRRQRTGALVGSTFKAASAICYVQRLQSSLCARSPRPVR